MESAKVRAASAPYLYRLATILLGVVWTGVTGFLFFDILTGFLTGRGSGWDPVILVFSIFLVLNMAVGVGLIIHIKSAWYGAVVFGLFSFLVWIYLAFQRAAWDFREWCRLLLWFLVLAHLFLSRTRSLFGIGSPRP